LRSFHGPLNFFSYTETAAQRDYQYVDNTTAGSTIAYADAREMLRPHMVFILFEDISTAASTMNFNLKISRNFEAIPTGAGEYLQRNLCQLNKYSHPLEILRDDRQQFDG